MNGLMHKTRMGRFLLGLGVVLLVTACATPLPPAPKLELTYAHLDPINLAVGQVEVVEDYVPPLRDPNIDHLVPVSPTAAARRWAEDRLRSAGGERRAQFVINNAEVIETKLPVERGVRGAVTVDQAARYDATLKVTLEIRDGRGFRVAFATAEASRSATISENLTLRERDLFFFRLVEELVADLNVELEARIGEFLEAYLS